MITMIHPTYLVEQIWIDPFMTSGKTTVRFLNDIAVAFACVKISVFTFPGLSVVLAAAFVKAMLIGWAWLAIYWPILVNTYLINGH